MGWFVNIYKDKEEDEKLARLEFEICKEDEYGEHFVDRFVHVIEDDK